MYTGCSSFRRKNETNGAKNVQALAPSGFAHALLSYNLLHRFAGGIASAILRVKESKRFPEQRPAS